MSARAPGDDGFLRIVTKRFIVPTRGQKNANLKKDRSQSLFRKDELRKKLCKHTIEVCELESLSVWQ